MHMSPEVYHLAEIAQQKLISEAGHKDHNLYKIVHHAQLYDTLLLRYYAEEDRLEEENSEEEAVEGESTEYSSQLSPESEDEDDYTEVLEAIEFDVEMVKDYSLGSGEPLTIVEVCELVDDDDEARP